MKQHATMVWVLVVVATVSMALIGCSDESGLTMDGECVSDEDCPDGYICDDEGRCVDEANDANDANDTNDGNDANDTNDGNGANDANDNQQNQTNQDNQQDGPDPGDRLDDGSYDDSCTFDDRDDTFEPDELWSFQVDETLPYAEYDGHGDDLAFQGHSIDQVMMTPAVMDLDQDGSDIPDVIFTTFATTEEEDDWDQLVTGVLRAVDGSDGSHRWSVGYHELGELEMFDEDNPALGVMPGASVAVGDITGDGLPEVVAAVWDYSAGSGEGMQGIAAIDNEGEVLWGSDAVEPRDIDHWWGGPSLADLNGDGDVEIVVGPVVYDNNGDVVWDGRDEALDGDDPTGSNVAPGDPLEQQVGPLTVVEDINDSGTREVITGRAAFEHDGTLLWEVDDDEVGDDETLKDGYPGVADFDQTGTADVVVVSAGTVRIHDGANGDLLWGPVDVPDSGRLGPPTIADMTGDGIPEIGVAGSDSYVVLRVIGEDFGIGYTPDYNDTLVWDRPTQDLSSNTTGSSVFDFNGNGEASVVYNDEKHVHVFDGQTGDVIFEADNPSVTALDNPVIADVNNDGAANIVVPTSDFECGAMFGDCDQEEAGLTAFGDADDNWVSTRRVWNQHAYSINQIEEDGSVPSDPTPGYMDHNTFRLNKLTEIEPQAAPDLHPEDPSVDIDGCEVTVDVWVTNSGAIQVGTIPVSLYAHQDDDRFIIADTETDAGLAPGESERVRLEGTVPTDGAWDLEVVVDDDDGESTRNECNEDNNLKVVESDASC